MTTEECWILVFVLPMALGYVLMLASIIKDDINEWKAKKDVYKDIHNNLDNTNVGSDMHISNSNKK